MISGNALKNTTPIKNGYMGLKKKFSSLKMDNITVVKLKTRAKKRDIKVYYKLRKAELIHALEAVRLVEQKSNIFDEPIPNDPTPILQPTPWRPSNVTTKINKI